MSGGGFGFGVDGSNGFDGVGGFKGVVNGGFWEGVRGRDE